MLVICCLTSNAYHAGYALSTTRLLKTKRSIILSDVWFEDFLLVIDVIKPPGTYFNNNNVSRISLIVDLWSSALLSLLPPFFCCFCMLRWIQFESQQSVCNLKFLRQTLHASWELHDTFSKNVIDLCWILYNKPRMIATFFLQHTTAFILFLKYLHFKFLVLGKQKKNSTRNTT